MKFHWFGLFLAFALASGLAAASVAPTPATAPPAQVPAQSAPPVPSASEFQRFQWDEAEPWRRAQTLDRPILLVLTVSWSKESGQFLTQVLERPDIKEVLKRQYVLIVADADLRPDLRDRYPAPAWPAITVLTPTGDPVYFKPDKKDLAKPVRMTVTGVAPDKLASFLEESAGWYKLAIRQGGAKFFSSALTSELEARETLKPAQASANDIVSAIEQVRSSVDVINGGFAKAPKFLHAPAVEACLMRFRTTGDRELLSAAEKQMAGVRKLMDERDGGVHRIALREDWTGVQPERLLANNAAALEAFSDLARATSQNEWMADARRVAGFLTGPMSNSDGSFVSALATPGREAGDDAPAAGAAAPRDAYSGSTAAAARALLRYASASGDGAARERAMKALGWLESRAWKAGRGVVHAPAADSTAIPLLLEDQVEFIAAEIEAWEQTGARGYFDRASDAARFVRDNLRDGTGALRDRIPLAGGPRLMQTALYPAEANYDAVRQFARLHYAERTRDGGMTWGSVAGGVLDAMAGRPGVAGARAASRALASSEYYEGPAWVIFIGNPDGSQMARRLYDAGSRLPFPFRMRRVLNPDLPADLETIRAVGLVRREPPALYLSNQGLTTPGAGEPEEVEALYVRLADSLRPPEKKD